MAVTSPIPSVDDAQFIIASKGVAALNANIAADQNYLQTINSLIEIGLPDHPEMNPQRRADAFLLKGGPIGALIFPHIALTIKSLASISQLSSGVHPKREWLYALDTGRTIATEVPWSTSPLKNSGVWPTESEAIAESHAMLAVWRTENGVPGNPPLVSPVAFVGAL